VSSVENGNDPRQLLLEKTMSPPALTFEPRLTMSPEVKKVRIILVDDHPAVLRQTIQLLPDRFEVVDASPDGSDLLHAVHELEPELIILDITLPVMSGVELARRLRAQGVTTKIIFLTVHADPDYAWEAFHVGASAFVIKPRLASDLVPALEAALSGKRFVSPCPELAEFQ
jgi:DNA-binding NarL/FixJ family response regulator